MTGANQNQDGAAPLAQVIPIRQLPGRLDKWIEVPPGKQGVVIEPGGNARVLPPGRHRVLSYAQRVRGQGSGMKAGLLPAGPLSAALDAAYLWSGDQQLVDTSLLLAVEIADAARCFTELVVPRGTVTGQVLDLSGERGRKTLAELVRPYAADDLVKGLPTRLMVADLAPRLEHLLADGGLRLRAIEVLSFWPSEKREAVDETLQGAEALEDAQALYEQLKAELGDSATVRAVADEPPAQQAGPTARKDAGQDRAAAFEPVKTWLKARRGEQRQKNHASLWDLFRKQDAPAQAAVKRPPRNWWLGGALWVGFLLLSGYVLTRIGTGAAAAMKASNEALYVYLTTLWLVIIPLLFDAIKRLVEQREKISEETWMLPGSTRLDVLAREDRALTDRLVRQQVHDELNRSVKALDYLVTHFYQQNDIQAATRLRKARQEFEDAARLVLDSSCGAPPYLAGSQLNISRLAWDRMLDYDENLLMYAGALSEKVAAYQEKALAGQAAEPDETGLKSQLQKFNYQFSGRSLALRYQNPS